MARAARRKVQKESTPNAVTCYICGNEVCCEPSHSAKPMWRTLVCHKCGRYVIVETQRPLSLLCCGSPMTPDLGGLW